MTVEERLKAVEERLTRVERIARRMFNLTYPAPGVSIADVAVRNLHELREDLAATNVEAGP